MIIKLFGYDGVAKLVSNIKKGMIELGHKVINDGKCDYVYCNGKSGTELDRAIEYKRKYKTKLAAAILDLGLKQGTELEKDPKTSYGYRDKVLANADTAFAISDFTKSQLKKYWNVDSYNIGMPSQFEPIEPLPYSRRTNSVIIVGRLHDPLKRTKLVIEALELLDDNIELIMVNCGLKLDYSSNIPIPQHSKVSKDELRYLISHSKALLSPSVFEGLGLPPIEALTLGTPVIVSDIPVKRGVFGGTKVMFHKPDNVNYLANCIKMLLASPALGSEMVKSANELIEWYRPINVARRIIEGMEK